MSPGPDEVERLESLSKEEILRELLEFKVCISDGTRLCMPIAMCVILLSLHIGLIEPRNRNPKLRNPKLEL